MKLAPRMLGLALAAGLCAACLPPIPDDCPEYDDAPSPGFVELAVRNVGTTPLYYDRCGTIFEYVIDGVAYRGELKPDEWTCYEVTYGHDLSYCGTEKGVSSDWEQVEPMFGTDEGWWGLVYTQTTLPARCLYDSPPRSCVRAQAAPLGPVHVIATLYAARTCNVGDCAYTDPLVGTADFVLGQDKLVIIEIGH